MRRSILTFLSHFFAGVITILSTLVNPTISVILFLTFIVYEVTEDWRLNDKSFRDIREFGYGAFLTAVILWMLNS